MATTPDDDVCLLCLDKFHEDKTDKISCTKCSAVLHAHCMMQLTIQKHTRFIECIQKCGQYWDPIRCKHVTATQIAQLQHRMLRNDVDMYHVRIPGIQNVQWAVPMEYKLVPREPGFWTPRNCLIVVSYVFLGCTLAIVAYLVATIL